MTVPAAIRGVVVAAILTAGLAAAVSVAPPVSAHHCLGETDIFDNGGSVNADCHGRSTGRPPGTPGGVSEADLYESYCGDLPGELASYEIGPSPNAVTIEMVTDRGLDPSGEYVLYRLTCFGDDGGLLFSVELMYEVTPPVDPTVLRDRATAQLVLPDPAVGTFPSLENPALVQTPTWMWIEEGWSPLSAADGQGFTAVSVTATPAQADWDMGDGSVVTCAGPGERWEPGRYEFGSSCTHTYARSSAGEVENRYSASVTVTWDLTWSINGNAQGSFGQVDQTSAFSVAVGEVQAVESNGDETR